MQFLGYWMKCTLHLLWFALLALVLVGCATTKPEAANDGSNAYITYPITRITTSRDGTSQVLSAMPMRMKQELKSYSGTLPVTSTLVATTVSDLWVDLGKQIHIDMPNTARYRRIMKRYVGNQAFFDRISNNARGYLYYVVQEIKKRDMPMILALLPIVESDYNSYALSHAGAAGAWQIIPSTGRLLGIQQDWWFDGRLDIVAATDGALNYLQSMYDRFGDWKLALAAYNCGPGCVNKAIKYNQKRDRSTQFEYLKLPTETKEYVPKLYAISTIIKDPMRYGIFVPPIANKPVFAIVPLNKQVSFLELAVTLNISTDVLYAFNTGYKHWTTHPYNNAHLIVPLALEQETRIALQDYTSQVIWQRYVIRRNQTLAQLSQRDNLPLEEILQVHDIRPRQKYASNKVILVPIQKSYSSSFKQRFESVIKTLERRNTKQYYRVRSGDSLWTIARKHNISVKKLMRINRMSKKQYIYPGNKIKIYEKKEYQYARFTPPYTRDSVRISYLGF